MNDTLIVRRQYGFTLIEVMISLVIASLALVALTTRLQLDTDTSVKLENNTMAMFIASNTIAELRISGAFPDTGRSTSDLEFASREWLVTTTVEETGIEGLRRAVVTVADSGRPDVNIRTAVGFLSQVPVPQSSLAPRFDGLQTPQGQLN
ncbi:MAG: type II secretion system minor pseudopilin GspI [Pseudomonadota bacterium]